MYTVYTHVTVFWKINLKDTITEIHFLPVDESHTHSLSRDTNHLAGSTFTGSFFSNTVKPRTRVHFMAFVAPEGH